MQVCIKVILPVPSCCDSTAYHANIRDSFLTSYQKEIKFQMLMQCLGTAVWHLAGRVMFTKPCKLRNARERVRGILLRCHKQLEFSEAENKKFSDYLGQSANLSVKKDTEPFAEEGHHWIVEGSSREPNAQGAPLHFLHIVPSLRQKLHTSLRTSPGPLDEIYCHSVRSLIPGIIRTLRMWWIAPLAGCGCLWFRAAEAYRIEIRPHYQVPLTLSHLQRAHC
jgi:hypothetical protein